MTLGELGKPFTGVAWYWIEDTYGTVTTPALGMLPISCKIQNVRIDTGDRHKVLRDIGSPLACNFLELPHEPKLHLEYIPQCDDTLIDDAIDRIGSCCTLQSLQFQVGVNTCEGDTDDRSYYLIDGAKPATIRISASKGMEWLVVIDFEARSIVTSSAATSAAPGVLTGAYLTFNVAGEIRKTGGHVVNTDHIAFVTNSIEITVTHKLTGYTDHDSLYKSYLVEGEMDITGSVDITLDGGGALHIDEVLANQAFDLVIDMGDITRCAVTGYYPRLTLPACEWDNSSVDLGIGGEAIISSVPFTCKPSDCSGIVSQPTV